MRKYFDTILDEVDQYRGEIRCVVQLTTSPTFGERMRNAMKEFNFRYEDYAKQLEETFHCTYAEAEYFIYSTLSAIVDYVIWDDREKTQMLLERLYQRIVQRFKPEA